ncbi:molybdopterin molybdotransferase MoeA [Cupriavidus pinatubonensis]|uniref:molybdopterin molybdotransferase MoeA n=1 Tax=Cupriavidus pinatubonensis TaxID=248026 RepID=UPI001C72E11D|nr:molybdopterin molybdotransferase MoeA [Cupriavidus pinatubonensis]QYY28812.1 molybdopterin molybdotransferase MoeA [Cupriavidus pinatubonensis]
MLSFDEAQAIFANAAEPVRETETLWLGLATGRVLASDLVAVTDTPSADRSAMDGYAVRCEDWQGGACLPVQQVVYAGTRPQALRPGHAIRIYTGAVIPAGADAVVAQEDAEENFRGVTCNRTPLVGQHIRRQGEDVRRGEMLLPAGTLIEAGHIAALASQGLVHVPVCRLVEIAILTSGDEVAANDEPRDVYQVHDVNGPMLESLVQSMGAVVRCHRHVRDDERVLHHALRELAGHADLVLVTGGASVGQRDLVAAALASAGGELLCRGVNMRPGKPVTIGRLRGKPVVCLPGNPAAAYTTFALLVTPLLRRLQGRTRLFPPVSRVRAALAGARVPPCDAFWRVGEVGYSGDPGSQEGLVHVAAQQGAAAVSALGQASGFVRVGPKNAGQLHHVSLPYYDLHRWLG